MSIFESIGRSIKNVFVGSHKGEDVKDEWSHPHDSMPIANGGNRYAPPEKMAELESIVPRPKEEADWFADNNKIEKLDESGNVEEEKKSIHQEMYEIATAKYNPFSVGGSENIHDFDSLGGSENLL